MNSVTSKHFRTCFNALLAEIQDEARRAYRLWKVNPYHSVLQLKQVKPDGVPLYSACKRCEGPKFRFPTSE